MSGGFLPLPGYANLECELMGGFIAVVFNSIIALKDAYSFS